MVGLDDLKGLFQSRWFYDVMKRNKVREISLLPCLVASLLEQVCFSPENDLHWKKMAIGPTCHPLEINWIIYYVKDISQGSIYIAKSTTHSVRAEAKVKWKDEVLMILQMGGSIITLLAPGKPTTVCQQLPSKQVTHGFFQTWANTKVFSWLWEPLPLWNAIWIVKWSGSPKYAHIFIES